MNQKIIGVGHIVHNALHSAANLLPIDFESIVIKIYSFFYIYTVRVDELKEFCDEADTNYEKILGYSKTRWLAFLPAIERILKLYIPLKLYFLSQEECPIIMKNFFSQ